MLFHFDHIAMYYWHRYLNYSYSFHERADNGQAYVYYKELSDREASEYPEINQDQRDALEFR
jgi:hypothetical protein